MVYTDNKTPLFKSPMVLMQQPCMQLQLRLPPNCPCQPFISSTRTSLLLLLRRNGIQIQQTGLFLGPEHSASALDGGGPTVGSGTKSDPEFNGEAWTCPLDRYDCASRHH